MPKPPVLPVIDWKKVFDSGKEYAAWIAEGESPENRERIEAIRQDLVLEPEETRFLKALRKPVRVVAIAEDWCGDVVRHVPALQKLADTASCLHVRYISREQHPEVFVRFLTNGGEAIPKFVFLSDAFVECGNWGPMPHACRELIARGKACGDVAAARRKVAELYAADPKLRIVASEIIHLIDIASSATP
jgi:hypothetical protein